MKVRLLKRSLFSERLPYLLVTDVILMLRNSSLKKEALANNLEKTLIDRNLL